MSAQKKVFLTGFSGSGKSKLAPLLARYLEWTVVDTDAAIEQQQRRSCREIIQSDGLPAFRLLEEKLLLQCCNPQYPPCIVALGGGSITIPGMIDQLRAAGWVIWLRISFEETLRRTARDRSRPLLSGRSPEEVRAFIAERETWYQRAAHAEVWLDGLRPEQSAERIWATLHPLLQSGIR